MGHVKKKYNSKMWTELKELGAKETHLPTRDSEGKLERRNRYTDYIKEATDLKPRRLDDSVGLGRYEDNYLVDTNYGQWKAHPHGDSDDAVKRVQAKAAAIRQHTERNNLEPPRH